MSLEERLLEERKEWEDKDICMYLFDMTSGVVIEQKCCMAYYYPSICKICVDLEDDEADRLHLSHTKDCVCRGDEMDKESLFRIVSKVMSEEGRKEVLREIGGE